MHIHAALFLYLIFLPFRNDSYVIIVFYYLFNLYFSVHSMTEDMEYYKRIINAMHILITTRTFQPL